MMTRTQIVEHDTRTYALIQEAAKAEYAVTAHREGMHRSACDKKKSGFGRRAEWEMTFAQVETLLAWWAAEGGKVGEKAAEILAADTLLTARLAELVEQIDAMEAVYGASPWNRYFPCLNRDGHIHSSMRSCQTVNWDTDMGWATEMSGLTPDQAIHGIEGQFGGLGETLCSVCFPDAPAEWCRTRSDVTRAEREAAKAAREEARYVKRLRDGERFRDSRHSWVETVARCKEVLREEVEYRDYYGHGEHPYHAGSLLDAAEATRVLLAREASQPGTGATQVEIDKIVASAVKKNIKDGARLNPVTGQVDATSAL